MNPKIIIPLRPRSVAELQRLLLDTEEKADLIEVWLDGIKELDEEKIKNISQLVTKPLIVNLKNKSEGGTSRFGDKKRIEILKLAAKVGVDFVDADLNLPVALLRDLKKSCTQTKMILSFHDFEKTPKIERLQKMTEKAFRLDADVVKIATFTKSWDDCTPIFQISWELAKAKKNFLTMGMGKHGEPTRVITPLIGGLGMFAPLDKKDATAAGQLTVAELREWWGAFN
ncbi:type I 3-dehydroquinate dehydratase [Candidatus Gracilibacteria bacterium]|nr:type I 3-dehydroquinate dehydratase [Candidatus Gracilibacteria bacterium]MCF7855971.1 type I 3-dehydroquinate dehydratase [Candidatus Gracilibacteria bacterium]MCF7896336.1 type I 3-dehydroquinate dehydratase [Candidatus Gracilibacteria bacterium]